MNEKNQITNETIIKRYFDLYDTQQKSKGIEHLIHGLKVKHNVVRNMKKLKECATPMLPDNIIPKKPEYIEYENDVRKIFEKISEGKTKNLGGQQIYDIDGKEDKFQKEHEKILNKYEPAIKAREEQLTEYETFIQQPFDKEIKWYTFSIDDLATYNPTDENKVYNAIQWMIIDPEPPEEN